MSPEGCFTSEELLLVVETVSLHCSQLVFVLLNDLLQGAVQVLLLLLQKLLLLIEQNEHSEVLQYHCCQAKASDFGEKQNTTVTTLKHQLLTVQT